MPGLIDELMIKARAAQKQVENYTQEQVDAMVRAIGKAVYDNAKLLAEEAVAETRYGRVDSKILKQERCTTAAWYFLKDKKSVGLIERDTVNQVDIYAKPIGVIACVTPVTNPTGTTVSNAMHIIKCRNATIVAPHPRAKNCTTHCVNLMRDALTKLGAPADLIQVIETPSMDYTHELMQKVDVVIATGGGAMVKSAYSSGHPSFGVGPGNVQVVIAPDFKDYDFIAKNVAFNRAYDNGMPCTGEQTLYIGTSELEAVLEAFKKENAYVLPADKVEALAKLIFKEDESFNPAYVGMPAVKLAKELGLDIPENTGVLLFPGQDTPAAKVLRKEKLCPVIGYYTYDDYKAALDDASKNLLWQGAGHTSVVYTNDEKTAQLAGDLLPVCRVVVNQAAGAASGGSFINGLKPTMSLGCGSWGNNSLSENLIYTHLMNTTRLAYRHDRKIPSAEEIWAD